MVTGSSSSAVRSTPLDASVGFDWLNSVSGYLILAFRHNQLGLFVLLLSFAFLVVGLLV
jgi:hypothetical protein